MYVRYFSLVSESQGSQIFFWPPYSTVHVPSIIAEPHPHERMDECRLHIKVYTFVPLFPGNNRWLHRGGVLGEQSECVCERERKKEMDIV
jgi:hypothetical protein